MQVGSTVVHAERSGDLRKAIEAGRKIIITTVQKFPYILDDIGKDHRERTFAIIIDEAHSSQGGKTAAAVSMALSAGGAAEDDETAEDTINRIIESKKMLPNASYFAFTATPKNKTLQMFGEPFPTTRATGYRPFHSYTMKQATQERFIVDVLENFTPVQSYYKLMKTVEDDPEFDAKRASKKLRAFVEGNEHAIRLKAEIMVDHFHSQVIAKHKIGGQARAMVVTSSDPALHRVLPRDQRLPRRAQEPVQGDRRLLRRARVQGQQGHRGQPQRLPEQGHRRPHPGRPVPDPRLRRQVPDRLRRAAAAHDVRRQDPVEREGGADALAAQPRTPGQARRASCSTSPTTAEDIERAFAPYYRTTVLSRETDPNKLHDLVDELERLGVYTQETRRQVRRALPRRRRPRPARSDPRRLRGRVRRDARRRRPGRLQGHGEGVRADLQLPLSRAAVRQPAVGEALDLPRPPHPEAAGAARGRPLGRHPRNHRHGVLPRREARGDEDRARRRGRRARARPGVRRRPHHRPRAGAAVRASCRPSTTCSATSTGPTPTASSA